jgi:hypothetical protein
MYRDPKAAANERIAALQRELDGLKGLSQPASSGWWKWPVLGMALLSAVSAFGLAGYYWLGTPKSETVMRVNGGYSFSMQFRTEVSEVRLMNALGTSLSVSPGSAQPDGSMTMFWSLLPRSEVNEEGSTTFLIRYRALGMDRSTRVTFDGAKEECRFVRSTLAGMPSQWVAFVNGNTYFSAMLSFKYAIREIRYGYDDEPMQRRVRFKETREDGISDQDQIYESTPIGARSIRVQITYKDGTSSSVETIRRDDATPGRGR